MEIAGLKAISRRLMAPKRGPAMAGGRFIVGIDANPGILHALAAAMSQWNPRTACRLCFCWLLRPSARECPSSRMSDSKKLQNWTTRRDRPCYLSAVVNPAEVGASRTHLPATTSSLTSWRLARSKLHKMASMRIMTRPSALRQATQAVLRTQSCVPATPILATARSLCCNSNSSRLALRSARSPASVRPPRVLLQARSYATEGSAPPASDVS